MPQVSPSASSAIESVLAAKQSATRSNITYAVAAKTLGAQQAAGDAALQLLEAAAGGGKAPGKGANLDTAG